MSISETIKKIKKSNRTKIKTKDGNIYEYLYELKGMHYLIEVSICKDWLSRDKILRERIRKGIYLKLKVENKWFEDRKVKIIN